MSALLIDPRDGRRIEVGADESLLAAALRQGWNVAYSCRTGRCSSCRARVVAGETRALQPELGLSAAEAAEGLVLSCVRTACGEVQVELPLLRGPALPPARLWPCRIASLERLAEDVLRVQLRLPPSAAWRHEAGQFVDLIGPQGLQRSYSLANANGSLLELHIRRVPEGQFSAWWFEQAKPNDLLRLNGPLGTFVLRELEGQDLILLATGTGYAPVQAMLQALDTLPAVQQPRSVTLYWGGRQPADLYVEPACTHPRWRYVPVLSRAGSDWGGPRGHVQQVLLADAPDWAHCTVYACGNPAMVDGARAQLTAAGLPSDQFHADAFVPSAPRSATP
ncbi:2Fe-2S iron-sulfur cluster-binding protein [Inhella proteolytica]|uniref:2Fe-2S iron-sulfur cluster binding domain-containing protein n=1 Tax=Inhella proteolytica TaxID=2795029 RepID=A0A931J0D5_9BURK|nr:2Fe-2S iron-sulfur cluster-binding protein [Inhella proteolytica]MBH9576398.1 2Fe-2S iron-sulfur cluster binding domain-containing protein [Inhella proteolytica]